MMSQWVDLGIVLSHWPVAKLPGALFPLASLFAHHTNRYYIKLLGALAAAAQLAHIYSLQSPNPFPSEESFGWRKMFKPKETILRNVNLQFLCLES